MCFHIKKKNRNQEAEREDRFSAHYQLFERALLGVAR